MRPLHRLAIAAAALLALSSAAPAFAQYPGQTGGGSGGSGRGGSDGQGGQGGQSGSSSSSSEWNQTAPPLPALRNAGPCPFVKVLYDAARVVEFNGAQQASAAVAYTGEINDLNAACEYRDAQPITVHVRLNFALGRGPQATSSQRTYRYWVAVTQRNQAVLAKEYFDLPVTFPAGQDRVRIEETLGNITIPRANIGVSGSNFEILVGFDVTPEQAAFNRDGRRFHINAGQTTAAAAPASAPHP
jgi:hypothetical protein